MTNVIAYPWVYLGVAGAPPADPSVDVLANSFHCLLSRSLLGYSEQCHLLIVTGYKVQTDEMRTMKCEPLLRTKR